MSSIQQSWWQLSAIQIGGAICLPVIMVGQALSKNYGFFSAVMAIALGNLLLFLFGIIALYMSLQKRISTMENARTYFGAYGTPLLASTMIICLGGWFAIQLNVMSLSMQEIGKIVFADYTIGTIGMILSNCILGALLTIFALRGITALDQLSHWSMSLLIATIAYALYTHSSVSYISPEASYSLGGISLVLATAIGVIADMPTYYRFARSNHDGIISIVVLFLIALPLIELVGVYIGTQNPQATIIDALTAQGTPIWNLWIGLFLLLAGWTTNNTNLYSAATSLESLAPRMSQPMRIGIIGALATIVSCFNIIKHFEITIEGMTIAIGSMSAVILVRFIIGTTSSDYSANIACWALGSCLGIVTLLDIITLTTIPILDAWIVAAVATALVAKIKLR